MNPTTCPHCLTIEEDDHEGVCLGCGMTRLARVGRAMKRAARGGRRPHYSIQPMKITGERRAKELAIIEALFK